ncbi:MAG: acyltransferase family protein [Lachnospiraceae bacterium]|nr:acyltransferase family protein [Lachnospiraceae bacterium]
MKEKQREYYLDLIRIVAIMAVIAIHTELGELYMQMPVGSISYYICMFFSMLISFSPPVFFMVSGALLLDKEESIATIWKKRILRIFLDLLVVSLLYFLLDIKTGRCEADPLAFIINLFSKPSITPLWYMYAYLSFLICLPFLRGMAKAMNETTGKYLFVLGIILLSVLPEIQRVLLNDFNLQADLRWDWLLSNVVLFPMLGYVAHKKIPAAKLKIYLPILCVADIIWLAYQTYVATAASSAAGQSLISDGYRGHCALLNAVAIFMFFKFIQEKGICKKGAVVFSEIGGCVFGIYLFHGFFLDRIRLAGKIREMLFSSFDGLAMLIPSFMWILIVFTAVGLGVWIIRRIPIVRKFL